MFCNQCEQTAKGIGCTKLGVCGKTPDVADIQDLIIYAARGLAIAARHADLKGLDITGAGRLCVAALFATVTNVNFDKKPLRALLHDIVKERDALVEKSGITPKHPASTFQPALDEHSLLAQASVASTTAFAQDENCNSLACTLLFGLKGVAAYADHARILGQEDTSLYQIMFKLLAVGFDGYSPYLAEWVNAVLECGEAALTAMALLDTGNTGTYGHPEPSAVSLRPRPGKAILVTGHDLNDLHSLLMQTEGKDINIYTHGEMLPAHGYPALKKFPHFAGHFGTAWQNQIKEFPHFPGPVLFTTNCIQRPADVYHNNVFTTGLVGWPGTSHVENGEFGPVIEHALTLPGFTEESIKAFPDKTVMVGFAHNAVLGISDTVINAVKSGTIRHFFLVGGCDGARPGRNYYTEFVEKTPRDTMVMTLACGKFRFFDKDLGTIGGIPRLLDVGQCNDAFSAVKIAQALAQAFSCGLNDLPLTLILSWYEQKAVAVLLALLALGVKNIHLGPSLPAFITPAVLQVLIDNFGIKSISTVEEDLHTALARRKP